MKSAGRAGLGRAGREGSARHARLKDIGQPRGRQSSPATDLLYSLAHRTTRKLALYCYVGGRISFSRSQTVLISRSSSARCLAYPSLTSALPTPQYLLQIATRLVLFDIWLTIGAITNRAAACKSRVAEPAHEDFVRHQISYQAPNRRISAMKNDKLASTTLSLP